MKAEKKQGASNKKIQPVKDCIGQVVPAHLVEVFQRISELREVTRTLNDIHKKIKEAVAAGDKLYTCVKVENLDTDIGNLKRLMRFAFPYACCPICGSDINNKDCRYCEGRGWLNKMRYIIVQRELKQ